MKFILTLLLLCILTGAIYILVNKPSWSEEWLRRLNIPIDEKEQPAQVVNKKEESINEPEVPLLEPMPQEEEQPVQEEPVEEVMVKEEVKVVEVIEEKAEQSSYADALIIGEEIEDDQEEVKYEDLPDEYTLKPEWTYEKMGEDYSPDGYVDINLGHSPESFIKALFYQLNGSKVDEDTLEKWIRKMSSNERLRRIDVAVEIADDLDLSVSYEYSDPWIHHPRKIEHTPKKVKRDLGAVCMFFFNCPNGVNGKMSWANNHVPGMEMPSDFLKINEYDSGYYDPKSNPGFWYMELLDAYQAGLQFLLLNVYGPDLDSGGMDTLNEALLEIEKLELKDPVKLALFDDTWTWGKPYFSGVWSEVPDFDYEIAAAELIYNSKWKPFFSKIDRKHWYMHDGKPLIYFYNGGTIQNKNNSKKVFKMLKKMFEEDFGVEPFLCIDSAFARGSGRKEADQVFKWANFSNDNVNKIKGHELAHAMVRWDDVSRENDSIEKAAEKEDRLYKDDELLIEFLNDTRNADLAVIATWNDLGEGTGINRCYDYYWDMEWKKPTHFIDLIRRSQMGERLSD